MRDLVGRTRILDAGGKTLGYAQTQLDLAWPPSNLATTDLPATGDRPGSVGIRSDMAGVASREWRGLESKTKSYAKSVICATSAYLR